MEATFFLKARFKSGQWLSANFSTIRQYLIDRADELGIASPEDGDNCHDFFQHKDELWYSATLNHHSSLADLENVLKTKFGSAAVDWCSDEQVDYFDLLKVRPKPVKSKQKGKRP